MSVQMMYQTGILKRRAEFSGHHYAAVCSAPSRQGLGTCDPAVFRNKRLEIHEEASAAECILEPADDLLLDQGLPEHLVVIARYDPCDIFTYGAQSRICTAVHYGNRERSVFYHIDPEVHTEGEYAAAEVAGQFIFGIQKQGFCVCGLR